MTACIKVGVIFIFSLYFLRIVFVLTHPAQMTLCWEEFLLFLAEDFGWLDGLKKILFVFS